MTKPPKKTACPPAPGLPLARPVKLPRPRIVKDKPADLLKHAKIELLATSSLKIDPDNARTHDERQLTQLMAAIKKFGWLVPLVVDNDLMILAGHARHEVAKRMKPAEVPCIRAEHLTKAAGSHSASLKIASPSWPAGTAGCSSGSSTRCSTPASISRRSGFRPPTSTSVRR